MPALESEIRPLLLTVFRETGTPITSSHIQMLIEKRYQRHYALNTIRKYIQQLLSEGFIEITFQTQAKSQTRKQLFSYYQLTVKGLTETTQV